MITDTQTGLKKEVTEKKILTPQVTLHKPKCIGRPPSKNKKDDSLGPGATIKYNDGKEEVIAMFSTCKYNTLTCMDLAFYFVVYFTVKAGIPLPRHGHFMWHLILKHAADSPF